MTPQEMYRKAKATIRRAGLDEFPHPEDFLETIQTVAEEVHDQAAIYAGRFKATTTANYQNMVIYLDGAPLVLPDNAILMAAYDEQPLLVEKPMQYPGPADTVADSHWTPGPPENIWQQFDDYTREQSLWVSPIPDDSYIIHMILKMKLPTFEYWTRELPVRAGAHYTILAGCIAHTFISHRDFHDNAVKGLWEQKYQNGIARLARYERVDSAVQPAEVSAGEWNWVRHH